MGAFAGRKRNAVSRCRVEGTSTFKWGTKAKAMALVIIGYPGKLTQFLKVQPLSDMAWSMLIYWRYLIFFCSVTMQLGGANNLQLVQVNHAPNGNDGAHCSPSFFNFPRKFPDICIDIFVCFIYLSIYRYIELC